MQLSFGFRDAVALVILQLGFDIIFFSGRWEIQSLCAT